MTTIIYIFLGFLLVGNVHGTVQPKIHRTPCSPVAILRTSTTLATLLLCQTSFARDDIYSKSIQTGIEYYDYSNGDGPSAQTGSKVSLNYKGRLAGRQGWIYDDTFESGEPIRLVIGTTKCIRGLEIGLIGDGEDMPPMKRGSKRRLVIPSRLGYTSKDEQPIPKDFGQQQRLYGTVLNDIRGERERQALGDSITGKLVLDVELVRVNNKGI